MNYFKQHSIKSIKLEGDKLVIEYNNSTIETKEIKDTETQQIKSFAGKIGKNELSIGDLEQVSNNSSNSPEKSNKSLYIGLVIVGVLLVGIIAWLLTRNKKENI